MHPPVKPRQGPTGGQPDGDTAASDDTASTPGGVNGAGGSGGMDGDIGGEGGGVAPHTWPAPMSSIARISWQHCVPLEL